MLLRVAGLGAPDVVSRFHFRVGATRLEEDCEAWKGRGPRQHGPFPPQHILAGLSLPVGHDPSSPRRIAIGTWSG